MRCNRCGQENVAGAKFCSACGGTVEQTNVVQNAPVTPPMATAPIYGGFNNLNATAQTKKNPAHIVMIIECIFGILFITVVVGLVIWLISGKSDGTEVLNCRKESKAVTSSIALTYDKSELSKLEVTFIIDNTVDSDFLMGEDADDLVTAGFAAMSFSQYDGKEGAQYRYSEQSAITTISFLADFTKMSKTDVAEITDGYKGLTVDEAKTEYTENGFTCSIK